MTDVSSLYRLFQFIITKSTPFMLASMKYGTYFFFASAMTIAFFWTYFILPETSGVTLEEMDALFGVPAAVQAAQQVQQAATDVDTKELQNEMKERV
jgi:hypothetical protein